MCKEFYRLIYVKVKLRWFSFALFSLFDCWLLCVCRYTFFFSRAVCLLFVSWHFIVSGFCINSIHTYSLARSLTHSFDRKLILFDRCRVSSLLLLLFVPLSAHCSPCVLLQYLTKWWFVRLSTEIMANVSHHYVVFFLFILFFFVGS